MLKEKLQKDLNESLKSGDQLKRLVLGMVMTAVKNKELTKRVQLSRTTSQVVQLEKQSQLTDEEVIEVIAGEVKKRKEAMEQFKTGGRDELAQKEKSEMDILLSYLPEQLGESEVRAEVQKTIAEVGAAGVKDMGKVIGAVMAKLKGRADGGIVSKITKELLGSD
ncbi:MAG: GatB/YqeY domain-containing protein [Candidatus Yanofskybacteria bacterium]|nr:GatB/YqeY domain-containing protein [Candidatus Yanofskybacteria bacterium]